MVEEAAKEEYETVISSYYGSDQVTSIILIKVDTKEVDKIADKISHFDGAEDVFLVTGDTDIIVKVRLKNYADLKKFTVDSLGSINGIKETKTLMVVTTYKEGKVHLKDGKVGV